MSESGDASWLIIDGYEDEPAAFGVPPYVGFHIRYICGVLEEKGINYEYCPIDSYRIDPPSPTVPAEPLPFPKPIPNRIGTS